MAFVQSFQVGTNFVSTNTFTVTDTSVGVDPAIASRQILIYDYQNNLFTGAAIQFPLSAGSSISPSILTKDFAFNIILNWLDSGNNILYQSQQIGLFTGFLEWFFYGKVQLIAANSNIMQDTLFLTNMYNLRLFIDSATQAISIGGSIYNSESMILLAQNMVNNETLFF